MKTIFTGVAIALIVGLSGAPHAHASASAQAATCPPGYYIGSNGQCFPEAGDPVYLTPQIDLFGGERHDGDHHDEGDHRGGEAPHPGGDPHGGGQHR